MKFNDLTNQEFERLTAKKYLGGSRWECVCKCGKTHEADAYHLRSGMILSCGCLGIERRAAAIRALVIPIAERFWAKVQKIDDADSCWIWSAKTNHGGYGLITEAGAGSRTLSAHRVSYEINIGPIAEGLLVCHRCDNPPCVRPSHLFLGTNQDNIDDCIRKGRRNFQTTSA